jgi:hypothetical protein
VEDTWSWRDLPVLDAVVCQMDEINKTGGFPDGADIARSTRLGILDVAAALDALEGDFLTLQRTSGGPEGWFVTGHVGCAPWPARGEERAQ